MNKLFNELKSDERTESWETLRGHNLMNQFYCGNFSASVKEMIDENITGNHLIEFLLEDELHEGKTNFNQWFDREFFLLLGKTKVRFN